MMVVEYWNEDAAGFGRFKLKSTFETDGAGTIRKFDGQQLVFTSMFAPDSENWYAMAVDTTNSKNLLIQYYWNDPSSKAKTWDLVSHNMVHTHSVILDSSNAGSNS